MRRKLLLSAAGAAAVLLTLVLPGCASYDEYGYPEEGSGSVSVGVAVYGGYYAPGYVGGCCYGGSGGVIVAPPIHGGGYVGGPRPMPH